MKVNIDEFITEIEKSLNIKLFDYERKYLKTILEARQKKQRVITHRARVNGHYFGRADVILMTIDEFTNKIEKNMLYGDNLETPKGILEDLKNVK